MPERGDPRLLLEREEASALRLSRRVRLVPGRGYVLSSVVQWFRWREKSFADD
jgi:hypothetical protein